MGRIVFVNPFVRSLLTGGIKTTYGHAEILTELGFAAAVLQPAGAPLWCSERQLALVVERLEAARDDILVFPEVADGPLARAPARCRKVMFCQNQFYMLGFHLSAEDYRQRGFEHFIVPGELTRRTLQGIFGLEPVSVVPNFVDDRVFFPRDKTAAITTMPRKWPAQGGYPGHADLIRTIFARKYPRLGRVRWHLLTDSGEAEVAETLGRASVFLSLAYMEACPLAPLEAMASGCVVVGYHGYGGLEYATPANGVWLSPEQLEDVADALAAAIDGLERGDEKWLRLRDGGRATAARFNRERTRQAIAEVYGGLAAGEAVR